MTSSDLGVNSGNEIEYDVGTEFIDMCADEYVAISSDAWATTPLSSEAGPFSVNAQCWHAGPCMLSQMTVGPYVFEINPVHIDNEGPILVFEKVLSGFEYGERGGDDIYYGPGPIYLHGHKQLGRSIGTRVTVQELYVPREMVGLAQGKTAPNSLIYPTSLIGRIVHAEWETVFNAVTDGETKVSAQLFERFAAAIKIALGVNPQREDVRTQSRELLLRQIQRFIVQNLESPDLSVDFILGRHGVSRASLYRMFEPYGGIRNYVTNLRASKTLMDIWQNESQRGIVRSMQTRWGFSSGNDFNRTVRRLFGNTPKRLISGPSTNGGVLDQSIGFARDFVDQRWSGTRDAPASVAA